MQQESAQDMEQFETGTTTLGLVGSNAVVLAADKRATLGNLKASKEAQKVFRIDDAIGLTIAGSVGDAQQIIRIMRSQLTLHKLETKALSVKGAATLLSNILHAQRMYPFFNQFIMGGVTEQETAVYDLDPLGGAIAHSAFTATGSGSPVAYGVLEDAYEEGMVQEDAIGLAVRSIAAASERDVASGDGIDVAVVTEDGYERLDANEIDTYL